MTMLRVAALNNTKHDAVKAASGSDANRVSRTLELTGKHYPKIPCECAAERLTRSLLALDDAESVKDVLYNLAGEPVGSWVMECAMEVYKSGAKAVWEKGIKGRVSDFVDHDVSNYVVQAMMTHISGKALAEEVLSELLPVCSGTILKSNRMGVLFRLVQMGGREGVGLDSLYECIFSAKSAVDLVGVVLPEDDGGRLSIDVNGARVIYWFLEGGFGDSVSFKVRKIAKKC